MNIWHYDCPIGTVSIAEEDGAITHLFFGEAIAPAGYARAETPLLQAASAQLSEYFSGTRAQFDLPLAPRGTPFQQSVWNALLTIPVGHTRTYGEIAAQIGRPKAARAVGMANNRNPLSIFIPCHRVIGADGSLTGYAGGLDVKRYLLDLEKRHG